MKIPVYPYVYPTDPLQDPLRREAHFKVSVLCVVTSACLRSLPYGSHLPFANTRYVLWYVN